MARREAAVRQSPAREVFRAIEEGAAAAGANVGPRHDDPSGPGSDAPRPTSGRGDSDLIAMAGIVLTVVVSAALWGAVAVAVWMF